MFQVEHIAQYSSYTTFGLQQQITCSVCILRVYYGVYTSERLSSARLNNEYTFFASFIFLDFVY